MKLITNGHNYIFISEIFISKTSYFEIMAIHKYSEKKSIITNLNFIISELSCLLSDKDEKYETTWIILKRKRARLLWNENLEMFNSDDFICYLEKMCDEDRYIGGWNAEFSM